MIIDLKNLSPKDREDLIREAGDTLRHIPYPSLHPDRSSSQYLYEIVIAEDILQMARRKRIEEQTES
jgi:hypothetical protein